MIFKKNLIKLVLKILKKETCQNIKAWNWLKKTKLKNAGKKFFKRLSILIIVMKVQ